jgi:hypothetical protein
MELKVPVEELRKCKLFLACPMYGSMCTGMFTRSIADLSALCTHYGIALQLYFLFNESLITRARNYCCDEFMRSDATHLMFIDSDIGFNANDVLGLLALSRDAEAGFDVVSGPYPKKCISWEKIKLAVDKGFADKNPNDLEKFVGDYVFNPMSNQSEIKINEPVQVREAGTGFMMIRKDTMLKFRDHYPQRTYRPDHVRTEQFDGSREIHAFFDCVIDRGYTFDDLHKFITKVAISKDDEALATFRTEAQTYLDLEKSASRRYLSEDYEFCYNVWRMGGKVWFCPWMKLQHVGTYIFGGSLLDLAMIGAPATADVNQLRKDRAAPVVVDDSALKAAEEKRNRKQGKRKN